MLLTIHSSFTAIKFLLFSFCHHAWGKEEVQHGGKGTHHVMGKERNEGKKRNHLRIK